MAGDQDVSVAPGQAQEPLVLALDVGSTATRGALYDATGRAVGRRAKVAHAFTTRADGTSVVDPDQVADEVADVVTRLLDRHDGPPVAGVGLDTFASSLVGMDAGGRALTPCFTYADSRCAAEVGHLRERLDEAVIQQRTGTRLHSSYLAPRLLWLRATSPEVVGRVATWTSLGEHVHRRLLGATAASTPVAAWGGLLDRRTGRWDEELLDACGTTAAQLSPVQDPGVPIEGVDAAAVARRWPALAGARWFPAVADGLASNLGTGAGDASAVALAAATSGAVRVLVQGVPDRVPPGLWCYRVDARRSLLGGAVNDVGRLVAWAQATLRLPDDDAALDAVLAAEPDPRVPVVVPFLSGERSTGWAAGARAVVADLSAGTGPEALFRGSAEGVATTYARVVEALAGVAGRPGRLVASGRITQSLPSLLQVVADSIGTPVEHVALKRATLRGTALLALEVLAPDVPRASPPLAGVYEPRPGRAAHYAAVRARFDALYEVSTSSGGPAAG
ncbi:gluconokinase [Pseudokineococcus basanitobsidens]|uniref:Gluconokinase n=1 Tax=Pseudokineococcus basanitobsidens TaxID=1926649 RepID=A0ABU8RKS3_9ACTN